MSMEKDMVKTELHKIVRTNRGRKIIPCREAFRLAAKLKVSPAKIGRMCDAEKIKISGCQLGCF